MKPTTIEMTPQQTQAVMAENLIEVMLEDVPDMEMDLLGLLDWLAISGLKLTPDFDRVVPDTYFAIIKEEI